MNLPRFCLLLLLRNKPIRHPGATPMGSNMCGFDDSLSVTAAGEEPDSGCCNGFSRTSLEAVTETFEKARAAL